MIGGMVSGPPRVALVTGSSRGLGRVIALRLGRDGLAVAVNGLHEDTDVRGVVDSIRSSGGSAAGFSADVTDERQAIELVSAVGELLGQIDVLVVNATGPQPEAAVEEVPWEEYAAQLEFFAKSPVLLGQAVLPGMMARNWGRIVQIDSEVVDRIPAGRSAYATAKSAQVGLTRSWARELAPFGITVNAVAPGFVPVERPPMFPPRTGLPTSPRCRHGDGEHPRMSHTLSASSSRTEPASSPASDSWSTAAAASWGKHERLARHRTQPSTEDAGD
jgi:3-oxoacyl-[acyl-carrier protein] reductase